MTTTTWLNDLKLLWTRRALGLRPKRRAAQPSWADCETLPERILLSGTNGEVIAADITVDYDAIRNGQTYNQAGVTVGLSKDGSRVAVVVSSTSDTRVASPGRIINIRGLSAGAHARVRVSDLPHGNFHTYLAYKDQSGSPVYKKIDERGQFPNIDFQVRPGTTRATAHVFNTTSHPERSRDQIKVDFYEPVDNEAPAATSDGGIPDVTQSGPTLRDVTVIYRDNVGIDVTSLDANDVASDAPGSRVALLTTSETNGTKEIRATYRITGNWDRDDSGVYGVRVKEGAVRDEAGNPIRQTEIGTLRINIANRAPVPNGTLRVNLGQSGEQVIAIENILRHVSDPDGDQILGRGIAERPSNGVLDDIGGNRLRYRPNAGFSGSDGFTYTVHDGHGGELDVRVEITVPRDVTAPAVVLTLDENRITAWRSTGRYRLTAEYSDNRGIENSSVGDDDFVLQSPAADVPGIALRRVSGPTINAGGNVEVVYEFESPAGGWDVEHNGDWMIILGGRPVEDDSDNVVGIDRISAPQLTVDVEAEGPTAQLISAPRPQRGTSPAPFVVEYSSAAAEILIDVHSIDANDVAVTHSNGSQFEVRLQGTKQYDGSSRVHATYELLPPDGGFSWRDNGTVSLSVVSGEVLDGNGNAVPGAPLGQFNIEIENETPIGERDTYNFVAGQAPYRSNGSVLDNDHDTDNSASELFTVPVTSIDSPSDIETDHGIVRLNRDGTFTYMPTDRDFSGTDSFEYRVSDGNSFSSPVSVTLTVASQDIDVVVSSFDIVNDYVDRGDATIRFTVTNAGAGTARDFDVAIIHSDDRFEIGERTDDDREVDRVHIDSLAGGESRTITLTVQLDRAVLIQRSLRDDPGADGEEVSSMIDYLGALVDPDNVLAERNRNGGTSAEDNNAIRTHGGNYDDFGSLPTDVDGDGVVAPLDALEIISRIGEAVDASNEHLNFDGDDVIAPLDALTVITQIGYLRNDSVANDPIVEPPVIGLPDPIDEPGRNLAVEFDGDGDYGIVQLSDATNESLQNDFTVSLWFETEGNRDSRLFSKGDREGVAFTLGIDDQNRIHVTASSDGRYGKLRGTEVFKSGTTVPLNETNHLAMTWNNGLEVYLNGERVEMVGQNYGAAPQGALFAGAPVVRIAGDSFSELRRPFAGSIDEVSAWSGARDGSWIRGLYNDGVATDLQSHTSSGELLMWLRMGDGDSHPAVLDQAGGDDNLTLYGDATFQTSSLAFESSQPSEPGRPANPGFGDRIEAETLDAMRDDLSERTGIEASQILIVEVQPRSFNGGCLGPICPAMVYPFDVPGAAVELSADGTGHLYNTAEGRFAYLGPGELTDHSWGRLPRPVRPGPVIGLPDGSILIPLNESDRTVHIDRDSPPEVHLAIDTLFAGVPDDVMMVREA